MNNDMTRHVRVRAGVAYPAVSVALVVSAALLLTPFGPSQAIALTTSPTPTATVTMTDSTTPSPTASTTPTPSTSVTAPTAVATTSTTPSPAPIPSASSGSVIAPGAAPVNHYVLARIEGSALKASYLPVDSIVPDAAPFQTFRVRFQLHNAATTPITATPQLEYRTEGSGGYIVVPEKPLNGIPFHIAREWVPSRGLGGGTMQGALSEDIAAADLRIGRESGFAVNGHHSMGANPDRPVTLPSTSYTEQEFTISLTMDAKPLTGYELRITNGGAPFSGMAPATLRLGAPPAVTLSPGQHHGVAVTGPKTKTVSVVPSPDARSSAGSAFPTVFAAAPSAVPAEPASAVPAEPVLSAPSSVSRVNAIRYPLVARTLSAATIASSDIHGPYLATADQCGICHRAHAAKAPNLLVNVSESALCLTCHGAAAGANTNVEFQYELDRPSNVNNLTTREFYSHDAVNSTSPVAHTRSELNEFGAVSNRHSECADCHNSHKARTTDSTQSTDGWDASGRLAGVSGVSVLNGATPGSAPTYTFLDGEAPNAVTREYQLCFKCHSGFTQLPPPLAKKPSTDWLDKAVEFNPANPSFHPVEAAGKNTTPKMIASLKGFSTYKLWDFQITSTIRCLNCHASSTTSGPNPPLAVDTTLPLPGSALQPHTSANRGILLRNYRDRVLKSGTEDYSNMDFALCYVCHGEEPFANSTEPFASNATNFRLHGLHLTGLKNKTSGPLTGTDIDTPGDGQGDAICAECHFRLHSTTNKVGAQTLTGDPITGSRLVNFAPNVTAEPVSGKISWTSTGVGSGSCTLSCHGEDHTGYTYTP
jgi:predicted CXXCH cytochrome family protein